VRDPRSQREMSLGLVPCWFAAGALDRSTASHPTPAGVVSHRGRRLPFSNNPGRSSITYTRTSPMISRFPTAERHGPSQHDKRGMKGANCRQNCRQSNRAVEGTLDTCLRTALEFEDSAIPVAPPAADGPAAISSSDIGNSSLVAPETSRENLESTVRSVPQESVVVRLGWGQIGVKTKRGVRTLDRMTDRLNHRALRAA
jgi:hypothetical protein